LKEKLIGIIMMLLSTAITHFIAMDILPTTSCLLLEKIMMFMKVYNDNLLSRNHKDKKDNYNIWNPHLHLLKNELRGAIEEEEITN
jgi:hypothetical protein